MPMRRHRPVSAQIHPRKTALMSCPHCALTVSGSPLLSAMSRSRLSEARIQVADPGGQVRPGVSLVLVTLTAPPATRSKS